MNNLIQVERGCMICSINIWLRAAAVHFSTLSACTGHMLVRLIQTAKGRKMDKSSLIKAEKNPWHSPLFMTGRGLNAAESIWLTWLFSFRKDGVATCPDAGVFPQVSCFSSVCAVPAYAWEVVAGTSCDICAACAFFPEEDS